MAANAVPQEDARAPFDRRFERSFLRVYAFLLPRVADHDTAQRLTREALISSLEAVISCDDAELDVALLTAVKRLLRAEASRGGPENAGA
jgi:DNA-directed RNA polymerase specialized sigma24 family protein